MYSSILAAVGVLLLLNLFLTFALARQVRSHGDQLARRVSAAPRLTPGTQIPEFSVETVSGDRRSLDDMRGRRSIVAFFAPGCPPCHEQLPEFARLARKVAGGASQVLAVVNGEGDSASEFVRTLAGAASVVCETARGAAITAFSVEGYPSFFVLGEGGVVVASGPTVRHIASAELA